MKHSALKITKLLILISLFAHLIILSNASATTTRRLLTKNSDQFINTSQAKSEEVELGEGFFEGRVDLEKNDYAGVGANPEHDPKPPPKV